MLPLTLGVGQALDAFWSISNRAKRDKAMIPDNEIISIYPYG